MARACKHSVEVLLRPSLKTDKKFDAVLGERVVSFGARGMSDYTLHKDAARMDRYVQRHAAREDWRQSGLRTPGFWSRWLLWNKPSFDASRKDMERRFCLKISYRRDGHRGAGR